MSIRSVFFAGAEADLHGVIMKFPDVLGESLQHSMMGKRIPPKYPRCKSVQCQHALHTSHMRKCTFNTYMSFVIMEGGKWSCHLGILAQWLGHEGSALQLLPCCVTFSSFACIFPSQGGLQLLPQMWWSRSHGSTKNKHFPQLRLFTLEKLISSLVAVCQNWNQVTLNVFIFL